MKNLNDDYYKINTEKSNTKTIVFKEKDDDLYSVIDYLNSNKNLDTSSNGKKISLSKSKKIILKLSYSIDLISYILTIRRFLKRFIAFLLVIGIIAITLISAFVGVR